MENHSLESVYLQIAKLLRTFPLTSRSVSVTTPPEDPGQWCTWALPHLCISSPAATPFCTIQCAAKDDSLTAFLGSADRMIQGIKSSVRKLRLQFTGLSEILTNLSSQCSTYAQQAALQSVQGSLSLTAFRKIFSTYLSTAIETCCSLLFNQEHFAVGAELLDIIKTHLAEIGVSTHLGDLKFDFSNYVPYCTIPIDRKELDEQYESILLPSYYLGRSQLCQGKAACYQYQTER